MWQTWQARRSCAWDARTRSTELPAWMLAAAPWQSVQPFITPSSTEWYMKPPMPWSIMLPEASFFT